MLCEDPDVSHRDMMGKGREKTDLDVELDRSPIFSGDGVGLLRHAHGRAERPTEYLHQGRFDLSLA